jgi:mannose-6-phosphate isomerase
MGTHPSGPSELAASGGGTLGAWLDAHPAALGRASTARFGAALPFLFKVLSVGTALSIQSHPDKALAERLHREKPEVKKEERGIGWGRGRAFFCSLQLSPRRARARGCAK